MVILNNGFAFTASTLTNHIIVKGGAGNTGLNTSVNLPQPPTSLNGMTVTIRKYQNMGIVNINAYVTISGNSNTNILIPNGSITGTNTIAMNTTTSTVQFFIMDGYYYQII
jgi:hypothetical protein